MSKIWVYSVCYNESHFVKQFLTAYKDAERIVIFDNESTDNTVELLLQDPRVEVRSYSTNQQIRDDIYLQIKNDHNPDPVFKEIPISWKEARGQADWVIVVDFDEIFCNAWDENTINLDLSYAESLGFDIIKPYGYNMISLDSPLGADGHPFDYSKKGTRHEPGDKMCCFRPDRLAEINYFPGCHRCEPMGMGFSSDQLKVCHLKQYKLLHFKWWNLDHYMARMEGYQKRLSDINKQRGWGWHYLESLEYLRNQFINGDKISQNIFEL